jgi:hypothetical protein
VRVTSTNEEEEENVDSINLRKRRDYSHSFTGGVRVRLEQHRRNSRDVSVEGEKMPRVTPTQGG